jgi:flagellar biosynthetic protein FliQ
VIAPFLAVTLVVGLITSLLQSVTSLQEQTLTFAPKLVALAAASLLLAPWLLRTMVEFTTSLFARMGSMGP